MRAWIFAAAMALACTGQAAAQSGGASGIIFYDGLNYTGEQRDFPNAVTNLNTYGFNDRARSVAIDSRTWEVCSGANFTGRCVRLDRDSPNLDAIGLDRQISSARPVVDPAPRQALRLFDSRGMQGASIDVTQDAANLADLQFNDRTESLSASGAWQVCDRANFTGRCQVVEGDISDLRSLGLANQISSVRPQGAPPASGSESLRGRTAMFFATTQQAACAEGRASQDCYQDTADAFCRRQGYRESGYYAIDRRGRTPRLGDVLCLR